VSAPPRASLPNRRRAITETLHAGGVTLHVAVGLAPDGAARELFLRSPRPASDVDLLADDVGVLASLLLQAGYSAADLRGRLGTLANGSPSSVVGAAMQLAAEIEAEARS
jgi:hypothetical protein